MAIVYDKNGNAHKCGEDDAKILIGSGHFTAEKARKQKAKPEQKAK